MEPSKSYEFGPFYLDGDERVLRCDGQPVPLTSKVFDLLAILVRSHGRLVTKEELLQQVWPGTFIEENNITVNVSMLRKALAEAAPGISFIETVPRRGYRFKADVHDVPGAGPPAAPFTEPVSGHSDQEARGGWNGEMAGSVPDGKKLPGAAPLYRYARWIAPGVPALLLLAWFGWYFMTRYSRESASPAHLSIAILPFRMIAVGSGDELLGLGLADTMIARLSEVRPLVVRPTRSVLGYGNSSKDILDAGRELKVDLVLDGTVLRSGGQARITARLIRVSDGVAIWSSHLDEPSGDIFSMQDSVARQFVPLLTRELVGREQDSSKSRVADNPQAYQLYLKGLVFWNKKTEEGIRKAIALFREAIEADPTYAISYSGLADCYLTLATYGVLPTEEVYLQAQAAARQALHYDAGLAEPHATLGTVFLYHDWDWTRAEQEFKQAIALKPDSAIARQRYALGLMRTGRFAQALVEVKLAEQYDPLSQTIGANIGQVLYFAGRYDEAIEDLRKKMKRQPDFWLLHRVLGEAYLQKGDFRQAILELQSAVRTGGGAPVQAELGYAFASAGDLPEARRVLAELLTLEKKQYVAPFCFTLLYAALKEKDRALEYLQKCYEERSRWLVTLPIDPMLEGLRPDPRFQAILRKVNLQPR